MRTQIIKNRNDNYNAQIQYTEMQAAVLREVWRANGNCRKAAKKLGWLYVEVRKIFDDQKACVMNNRLRAKGVRMTHKEIAHLGWQKMEGVLLGMKIWRETEDYFRGIRSKRICRL